MKSLITILQLLVCSVLHLSLSAQTIENKYESKTDSFTYDTPSRIYYSFLSDNKNVYIKLKIQDPLIQRKILSFGLTIWVDTTNRKKEKMGIHFPKGREKEEGNRGGFRPDITPTQPKKDIPADKGGKEWFFPEIDIIELIGFNPYRESEVMLLRDSKIKPMLRMDSLKTLYYYCELPLVYLFKAKSANESRIVSIGLVTGKLEMPQGNYPAGGGDMGGRMMHWTREQKPGNTADMEKRQREMDELGRETRMWLKNIAIK
jgi:hypothetical protein